MLKLLWFIFKTCIILPIFIVTVYFGLMQPLSKRVSLMELPTNWTEGTAAFSDFGDFTARHLSIYRNYYNLWLPEDAHIQPPKKERASSI
ncbi:MAG: hypothetical protein AAF212_01320 [Verrucomicrobiota bacterium]